MADTLEVLLKIHKAIKDLSSSSPGSARLNQPFDSVNTNVSAMQAMQREAEKLNSIVKSVDDHAAAFKDSFEQAAKNMRESNSLGEKSFTAMSQAAKLADKALGNIVSKTMGKLFQKTAKFRKEVENIGNAYKGWRKNISETEGKMNKLFLIADGLAAASGKVLSSFVEMIPVVGKVIGSVVALGGAILKSVVGVFGTALSAAGKFAKFLFTLPIGIANRASEMGGQLRQELVEVIGQAVENTKELFDLASNGGQAFKRLGGIAKGSLLTFQSVNSTMTKLFGYGAAGAAKMVSDITKNISDMGLFADIFAESTTKSGKSIEFITRMTRGMAMGADDLNYVVREAMKNGEHYFETMTRMKLASDAASQEFGVNRKLLSKNFFQLRKDITQFGHLSDIELMRVAARATQLGVEMKDLAGVFNKFGTFEDAANSAALLSQTFGMNIDALQLIRAEDPTEIVEMFRNSMLATGRSFDDLNRHEKSLMATHTGMSVEALKTTMNYRTLGKSYEEIKEIMNNQKPEERQIRAMKDMKTSMSEIQKIMDKKDFFTAFTDGLSKTILYNSKLGESFISINKQMERFYENGLTLTTGKGGQREMLDKALAPFAEIVDKIKDIFSIDSLNEAKRTIIVNLGEFIQDITSTNFDSNKNTKWSNKIRSMFSLDFLVNDSSFFGKLAMTSGKIIGYILRAFAALGPGLIKGLGDAIHGVLEFINNPSNKIFDNENLSKFLGFDNATEFGEFTNNITNSLKDMRGYLFGGGEGKGILSKIFDQIKELLGISKDSGILVTAGTAIGQGMIAALKAAGGLMSLLTGETPKGPGSLVEQKSSNSLSQQAAVAVQNTINTAASQGFLHAAFHGVKETVEFIGRNITTALFGENIGEKINNAFDWMQQFTSEIGYATAAVMAAKSGAVAGRAAVAAADEIADPIARGVARSFGTTGAKAATRSLARGAGFVVGGLAEGANYYMETNEAAEMANKQKGLSARERQKMIDNANSAQMKDSGASFLGSLGGAAAGLGTAALLATGPLGWGALALAAGVGGLVGSELTTGLFGTESATESMQRQIAEREKLQKVAQARTVNGRSLREINSLDGNANALTRQDIEMFTNYNKEQADKIIEALLNSNKQDIRINIDGKEIAQVVTDVQQRQVSDASLRRGTRIPGEGGDNAQVKV